MKLSEAAQRYVAEHKLSERSLRFVLSVPKRLSEHLNRDATTADLTVETIRSWLAARAITVGELAVKSDARRCVTLWRWCALQGWSDPPWETPVGLYPSELRQYKSDDAPNLAAPPRPPGRYPNAAPPRPDRGLLSRVFKR